MSFGFVRPCGKDLLSPPPSIWNLDRNPMVGGLKRPQNLVRGAYVDWFDFYSNFKIRLNKVPGLRKFFKNRKKF